MTLWQVRGRQANFAVADVADVANLANFAVFADFTLFANFADFADFEGVDSLEWGKGEQWEGEQGQERVRGSKGK